VSNKFHLNRFVKSTSASLLAALVLCLSLLGSSPALHKLIHSDAGAADHHCAITLFAKGQVNSVNVVPLLAVFVVLFGGISLLVETFLLPLADYRFSASRAPPAYSSLLS
jgi:hypothetical protein